MKNYNILIFLFLANVILSQEYMPPIINYTPRDYNAESQNWSVNIWESQDVLVSANNLF